MAGHSKWKNIKHKKAAADAVKMKKFTKLLREISAVAQKDPDLNTNPSLRNLIEKANRINMPKENYLRAIKKSTESNRTHYETLWYQGYAPGNIPLIVEVLCENKNKTAGEIRQVFSHNGGRLVDPGSLDWMFHRCGIIEGVSLYLKEDELLTQIIDFNLYDFSMQDENVFIAVDINDFNSCKEKLLSLKISLDDDYLGYHPINKNIVSDQDSEQLAEFVSLLENLDDVQNVFVNA
jgi:YebC/PmpR family DNA-binding regulatory protein